MTAALLLEVLVAVLGAAAIRCCCCCCCCCCGGGGDFRDCNGDCNERLKLFGLLFIAGTGQSNSGDCSNCKRDREKGGERG